MAAPAEGACAAPQGGAFGKAPILAGLLGVGFSAALTDALGEAGGGLVSQPCAALPQMSGQRQPGVSAGLFAGPLDGRAAAPLEAPDAETPGSSRTPGSAMAASPAGLRLEADDAARGESAADAENGDGVSAQAVSEAQFIPPAMEQAAPASPEAEAKTTVEAVEEPFPGIPAIEIAGDYTAAPGGDTALKGPEGNVRLRPAPLPGEAAHMVEDNSEAGVDAKIPVFEGRPGVNAKGDAAPRQARALPAESAPTGSSGALAGDQGTEKTPAAPEAPKLSFPSGTAMAGEPRSSRWRPADAPPAEALPKGPEGARAGADAVSAREPGPHIAARAETPAPAPAGEPAVTIKDTKANEQATAHQGPKETARPEPVPPPAHPVQARQAAESAVETAEPSALRPYPEGEAAQAAPSGRPGREASAPAGHEAAPGPGVPERVTRPAPLGDGTFGEKGSPEAVARHEGATAGGGETQADFTGAHGLADPRPGGETAEAVRQEAHAPVRTDGPRHLRLDDGSSFVVTRRGPSSLEVSLRPEGMGKLEIEVNVERGVVNAHISASDPAGKEAIERNLHGILNALSREGFNVGGFSVALKERRGQGPGARRGPSQDAGQAPPVHSVSSLSPLGGGLGRGKISVFA
ncbi:MAG: hypothetical protein Kow0025_04590 [Thermodesulfovibrionales bacterium]